MDQRYDFNYFRCLYGIHEWQNSPRGELVNLTIQSMMQNIARLFYTEHCAACSNQSQTAHMYQNADSSLRKHEDLTQCCFNIGPGPLVGGPILKQHWVKSSCLLGSTQVSVYTHPSHSILFSPADQGTFSKTAGQAQAYYNT